MAFFSNISLISSVAIFIVFTLIMWILSNRLILSKEINLTRLFLIGALSFFLLGGLATFVFGNSAIDIQMHDTYFVVAHAHLLIGMAVIFVGYAGFYHLFSFLSKREMNETMGKMHFLGTIIIVYAMFWLIHYIGIAGVPRRYYQSNNFDVFGRFEAINSSIITLGLVLLLIQIIPFINAIYSLIYGKRIIR